ncbi:MAG: hypothetical protein A3I02_14895 [Betaproteobacteria bacterium RIFCSPLOWO2_02_FULL_67_26]|nr:MAG: hypothetical protein A3I02_14895 [Betaproteobacteria bacterium RIFCSPLOWO2_02_FULL_67_26]
MGLFGSVSGRQVDEFAKSLVGEIAKVYPPEEKTDGPRKSSQKKVASALEGALKKAVDFKKQHRLGIYKTARLGNTFRWEMKELGYSEPFVEALVKDLVIRLSVK